MLAGIKKNRFDRATSTVFKARHSMSDESKMLLGAKMLLIRFDDFVIKMLLICLMRPRRCELLVSWG